MRDFWSPKWQAFAEYFLFLLPIILPTAPYSSSCIIPGWYNKPNSGMEPPRNNKDIIADF
jgi:hypothetical protein